MVWRRLTHIRWWHTITNQTNLKAQGSDDVSGLFPSGNLAAEPFCWQTVEGCQIKEVLYVLTVPFCHDNCSERGKGRSVMCLVNPKRTGRSCFQSQHHFSVSPHDRVPLSRKNTDWIVFFFFFFCIITSQIICCDVTHGIYEVAQSNTVVSKRSVLQY